MLFIHQRLSKVLVTVCIVALWSPIVALAQDGVTTQKLREQIALMEKIDKDSTTGDEVRVLNRELLAEKRAQLATRLTKEIDGLQTYSQTMESSLSESDKQKIASRLAFLRQELNGLRSSSPPATASTAPASTVQPNNSSSSIAPVASANADTTVVANHPSPTECPSDLCGRMLF